MEQAPGMLSYMLHWYQGYTSGTMYLKKCLKGDVNKQEPDFLKNSDFLHSGTSPTGSSSMQIRHSLTLINRALQRSICFSSTYSYSQKYRYMSSNFTEQLAFSLEDLLTAILSFHSSMYY